MPKTVTGTKPAFLQQLDDYQALAQDRLLKLSAIHDQAPRVVGLEVRTDAPFEADRKLLPPVKLAFENLLAALATLPVENMVKLRLRDGLELLRPRRIELAKLDEWLRVQSDTWGSVRRDLVTIEIKQQDPEEIPYPAKWFADNYDISGEMLRRALHDEKITAVKRGKGKTTTNYYFPSEVRLVWPANFDDVTARDRS